MRAALDAVLVDPVFVRSPALARLLAYLVEQTVAGRGKTLKSYSVAVDGLGRSADFDAQVDTYARVLVMRLRKALDAYYARGGAHHARRLAIASGSYEVLLEPNGGAPSQVPPAFPLPPARAGRLAMAMGVLAGLGLAIAGGLHWRAGLQADAVRWRTSNFPFVDVSVEAADGGPAQAELARRMRQSIMANIDDYEGVRVAYAPSDRAAYQVKVSISKAQGGYEQELFVIDKAYNRLIFSDSSEMTFDSSDDELSSDRFLALSVFRIVHPTGILHSNERRRLGAVDTPYGCWLHFTRLLQSNPAADDATLADCAESWQAAAPGHPLAAALLGWARVNRAITRFTDAGRRETLDQAIAMLESARAMNPGSPTLQLSTMRAYTFIGDGEAMRGAAAEALKLNPRNLDIMGVTGMTLALQNDPQGEILLNRAIADHFNPPQWYFVGSFVAAMMREDTGAAGRALAGMKGFRHALPVNAILTAAYHARMGHIEPARAAWADAAGMQPLLRIKPEIFFARLPVAPAVRKKLELWLAPVLR